jgi:hypothetical protein
MEASFLFAIGWSFTIHSLSLKQMPETLQRACTAVGAAV